MKLLSGGNPQIPKGEGDEPVQAYIAAMPGWKRSLRERLDLIPLYEWSSEEICEPRVLELVREGNPTYAWPFEQRHVWRTPDMPFAARVLERATRAR